MEGLAEEENTVNWYFSNYNNENPEPYIGPGGEEVEGARRSKADRSSARHLAALAALVIVFVRRQ